MYSAVVTGCQSREKLPPILTVGKPVKIVYARFVGSFGICNTSKMLPHSFIGDIQEHDIVSHRPNSVKRCVCMLILCLHILQSLTMWRDLEDTRDQEETQLNEYSWENQRDTIKYFILCSWMSQDSCILCMYLESCYPPFGWCCLIEYSMFWVFHATLFMDYGNNSLLVGIQPLSVSSYVVALQIDGDNYMQSLKFVCR